MKALRDLRRFVLVKCAEGNQREVRLYVAQNVQRLSSAFHVQPQTLLTATASIKDDGALACKLLETIMRAEGIIRKQRKESRALAAQASATALASYVEWKGERALIDMPSLLSSALTRRNDLLVFTCEGEFTVSVYMAPLLDLAKIARARDDLSGFVDREGVHLRWRTGGLNLLSQQDANAERIIVTLPPMPAVIAA
jgi:hypothetical protein